MAALDSGLSRRERLPCSYEAYVPDALAEAAISLPSDVAADLSDAERAVYDLNSAESQTLSLEALARMLLRSESVASSHIEGLEVGAARLLRAEAASREGLPAEDVTAEEVLGNISAMEFAVSTLAPKSRLELDDLLALHRALMEHTPARGTAGQVRTKQNWIGGRDYNPCGADFVPPPPENVSRLLDDLMAFLNSDETSPLVQAAIAHAQFETIHPFGDGNGRVGRALIHLVFRRRGLAPRFVPPISLVLATESRSYIDGLTRWRTLAPPASREATDARAAWIATFASATRRSVSDALRLRDDVEALERHWRQLAAPVRANSSADRLLKVLPSAPVITAKTAAELTQRTFQAASVAIKHLTTSGVLQQTTIGKRNRAFEAVGMIELLTDAERRLASPARDTHIEEPVRRVPHRRRREP